MEARDARALRGYFSSFVRTFGKRTLFQLVGVSALGLGALGCLSTRGPSVPVEAPAPEFTLTDQQAREVSLSSLLRDGPAVVVFYRGFW